MGSCLDSSVLVNSDLQLNVLRMKLLVGLLPQDELARTEAVLRHDLQGPRLVEVGGHAAAL